MNTPTEEKQRRKSIGTPGSSNGGLNLGGGKTRRYSIGVASSQKGVGEEGNVVPNYLRASTGSCHDFCKYGKKHEHSKSAIPITFKRTTIVSKEKFTKTVVPIERNKTKMVAKLEPSTDSIIRTPFEPHDVSLRSKKAQVSKRISSTNRKATESELKMPVNPSSSVNDASASAGTNSRIKKKDIRAVKKTGVAPTTTMAATLKRIVVKTTPIESQSSKRSFDRAASLKAIKDKNLKQVSPLKDQNRMQKNELKKLITDNVQTKNLHGGDAESEAKPQTMEFEFICSTIETIQSPPPPSMELISDKNVIEEESMIVHPVYESSQLFPDKELLEESLIVPPGFESSQSSSDRELLEGSSIKPTISERSQSSYEEGVLEEDFEYTDGEEVESFCEEEFEGTDDEEVFPSGNNDEPETLGTQTKIPRKGRMVNSEDKDEEGVKLRFRRGTVLDLQSENNGPRRLKFKRRVIEGNEDGQTIARRTYKNKTLDLQAEINGPRRLPFRKGKVMEGHEHDGKRIARRTFEKKYIEEKDDSNHGLESVVLKHQGEQGKKDAQGLFNNVIEETASKLVESRKSKVKALVGAFETVISLQDSKPSST
ncbi:uncharacterized protein LOC112515767 [Cynara cardunculus var. scolymus]|uniref:uncharacterized protein LOC112515767 n=1 Tax=Cynara cardunculus var. scolymus TaxID=59895 RepID=UPI000D623438|nr:uncharacterized protein LOC112515767 [Cynara cardunculus var. scolymus]